MNILIRMKTTSVCIHGAGGKRTQPIIVSPLAPLYSTLLNDSIIELFLNVCRIPDLTDGVHTVRITYSPNFDDERY